MKTIRGFWRQFLETLFPVRSWQRFHQALADEDQRLVGLYQEIT